MITLLAVPEHASLGDQQILAQPVVLGFGAAVTLWGIGVGLWLMSNRLLTWSQPPAAEMG